MNESISKIEFVVHLKAGMMADMRKAVTKVERIAALVSTLALTIQAARP